MTFRNWASLEAPVSRFKPRQPKPGIQSDTLSRQRTQTMINCVNRSYHCDHCRRHAPLLFPVSGAYVCLRCRDAG
jgi:hypothetical protein